MNRKPIGAFEVVDVDLAGRIGKLHLRSGTIETPAFFPVVDPLRQDLPLSDIRGAGFSQIITNAYLALKRYGEEPPGTIHRILGWDGIVMTDSGAYQILEYGEIDADQESILIYQRDKLRSDIGVILDVPTGDVGRDDAERSVAVTLRRAKDALSTIDPRDDEILWVLPVQGGGHLDLLARSARESAALPYRMYGLGSPTVFLEKYRYEIIIRMIQTARKYLPAGKPLHLFGAGHPLIIPFAVALGVDTFDSASYILYARDDRYMTDYGVYRLDELDYLPCSCPVCSKYDVHDLQEMNRGERTRLLALHNLYVISRTMKRVKQAIAEGRLWELLEETARRHPAAQKALMAMRFSYPLLESLSPGVKPRVKGLRLYGYESLWNPKLIRYRSKLFSSYLPGKISRIGKGNSVKGILLRPLPDDIDACWEELGPQYRDHYIIYYSPYIGLVPRELCGVYPTIHHDFGSIEPRVLSVLVSDIVSLHALARRYNLQVIVEGSHTVCQALSRKLRGKLKCRSYI